MSYGQPNWERSPERVAIVEHTPIKTTIAKATCLRQLPFLDSGTLDVPDNISDHKATYITLPFQYDTE